MVKVVDPALKAKVAARRAKYVASTTKAQRQLRSAKIQQSLNRLVASGNIGDVNASVRRPKFDPYAGPVRIPKPKGRTVGLLNGNKPGKPRVIKDWAPPPPPPTKPKTSVNLAPRNKPRSGGFTNIKPILPRSGR